MLEFKEIATTGYHLKIACASGVLCVLLLYYWICVFYGKKYFGLFGTGEGKKIEDEEDYISRICGVVFFIGVCFLTIIVSGTKVYKGDVPIGDGAYINLQQGRSSLPREYQLQVRDRFNIYMGDGEISYFEYDVLMGFIGASEDHINKSKKRRKALKAIGDLRNNP